VRILYPSLYGEIKTVEPMYAEELGYMIARNRIETVNFSMEEFEQGKFKKYGIIEKDDVLYRGWMMNIWDYRRLFAEVELCGAKMLVSPEQYELCHYLPNWYELIKDLTAETVIYPDANGPVVVVTLLKKWGKIFIKDYVKSAGKESICSTMEEFYPALNAVQKIKGELEGGLCIRKFEEYVDGSERRYFVFKGRAFSPNEDIPQIVVECSKRINSPFFSVDVAERTDGVLRVIEIGDGQVSDLKTWPAERFSKIFGDNSGRP